MVLDCLNNLVGSKKGCSIGQSDSGLFLHQLPFMDLNSLEAITSENNSTVPALLESTYSEAKQILAQDIYTQMAGNIKKESVIENEVAGFFQENLQLIATEAKYKGIHLKVQNLPYSDLFISSITLQTDFTGTIPVFVFDLITGKVLNTFQVVTVANEKSILDISFTITNYKQKLSVFVCYDASAINYYKTAITSSGCANCQENGTYLTKRGAKMSLAATKIDDNLVSSDTGGMSLTYSLNCNIEPYICSIKNLLAYPLRSQWALQILENQKHSKRVNSTTIIYKGDINELITTEGAKYAQAMDRLFQNLPIPDAVCFKCNKRIFKRVQVP